jgi:hypothetical protein
MRLPFLYHDHVPRSLHALFLPTFLPHSSISTRDQPLSYLALTHLNPHSVNQHEALLLPQRPVRYGSHGLTRRCT